MSGWRSTTLGEFASLQRGHDLPDVVRKPGSVPVMGSFGITGWHSETKARGPGVTVGRSGASMGVVCYIDRDYWPLNTCLFVTDFHDNNSRFVYYFLKTLDFQRFNSGSAQATLNRNVVHPLSIKVPQRPEQDLIAALLGALDDKIELIRRMNETLEGMARAIFRDWFVNFGPTRAKIEGRAPYLAPEIWSLFPRRLDDEQKPDGWSEESVFAQANWVNGAAYKDMHFSRSADALPVIKIAELKNGVMASTMWTNTDLGERYRIRTGELLFSWSGNPDTSIDTFIWTGGDAWLNQHIFAVRPNGSRSVCFLFNMLKWLRPEFAEIARNKQTTGLGHVTQQDLIRLKVCVPTKEVESAFALRAEPIYRLLQNNMIERQTLAECRDALLPKLMSGEIRIKEAEKAVAELV